MAACTRFRRWSQESGSASRFVVKPGRGGEAHFDLSVVQRKRLLGSFFARGIARNTTAWVANSREIAADLARWGVPRERVHAIPNGIDVPEDGRRQASNGVVRLLSMGRLDAEKAVDQTIRAFAALPADTPARLTILGDGPCRQELEALSRRLGQDRRIVFPGAVADVTPYLREADVYRLHLAVGGHVERAAGSDEPWRDACRLPGERRRRSGGGGRVRLPFPPGDESALAARLEESLDMTGERRRATGEAARAAIRARFSIEKVAERHLTLYRKLIEAGPCAKA